MIIYQADKRQFLRHAFQDDIEDVVSRHYSHATGQRVSPAELRAWTHSLSHMAKVLNDDEIPDDAGVAIEYQVPQTAKRIDFLITGLDEQRQPKVVIVELKQWSEARISEKDGIIWARRGGRAGETEGAHPSYQAWSYAALLNDFNAAVLDDGIALQPCAYLHNYPQRDGVIDHPSYSPHIERAPLFLKPERDRLQAFIRRHVRHGDSKNLLYRIEHGRIQPSKMLADAVVGLLQGKNEFVLIDDQKLVYESVLEAEARAASATKQVVIVQGGPGTGKSVVAINLLAALIAKGRNARYVSKNAAPRAVFEAKLTGTFKKTRISNLFSGSGAFTDPAVDNFDALIVDEAHRLNEKSGLYGNLGENQVKEIITSARCSVFFVDDDQRVTISDIGHTGELRRWAAALGAQVTELSLASQFRCSGSDGYMAWLDDSLAIRPTANQTLDTTEYDFRVVDSPTELHALIHKKNQAANKARVVAGYCWGWPSKTDPQAFDIDIPEYGYQRRWNLSQDGSLWIVTPGSVEQVGCIHTCQGLELDYVGVIIGPDLGYRDGKIQPNVNGRARSDKSIKGLKSLLKRDPHAAKEMADRIIKNTYRTLMTRGIRGCFVYCTDGALAEYLRARLHAVVPPAIDLTFDAISTAKATNVFPLRTVTAAERAAGSNAAPVIALRFAAGSFSEPQSLEENAEDWVELPDWVSYQTGLFVAQVVGESMNKRIPNGAWCLFRAAPGGTRNGKIVVVQHRSIADPETGGSYTIKRYSSEKILEADGTWRHTRIELAPETDRPGFETIVLEVGEDEEFSVIAEMLMVL
ncbi:DNA/RNA helicase domain-containing protein [Xylophilus sp. GW821-FHT01B05]